MSETFETSTPPTSGDLPRFTCLLASAVGREPCALQVGATTGPSGQDPARANLSPRQAEAAGLLMSGTFGRTSITSSASATLAAFMVSRFQAQTDCLGSTLYKLTWKDRVTPQQQSISARRASVLRTSGSGSTGWPTPKAEDAESTGFSAKRLAEGKTPDNLNSLTPLAGWASPQSRDHKGSRTGESMYADKAGRPLNEQAANLLDGWKTENGPARRTASGLTLTGSSAGMESGGQLSPEHSCWLQGFPTEWVSCGVSVMRSSLRKQSRS